MIVETNLFVLGTSEQVDPSYHIRVTLPAAAPADELGSFPIAPRDVAARWARLARVGGVDDLTGSLDL